MLKIYTHCTEIHQGLNQHPTGKKNNCIIFTVTIVNHYNNVITRNSEWSLVLSLIFQQNIHSVLRRRWLSYFYEFRKYEDRFMSVLLFHAKLFSASKLNFFPALTSLPVVPLGSEEHDGHSISWASD